MTTRSGIPQATRNLVIARDHWRCVRCLEAIVGYDYSLQHRVARGMGGSRHAARPAALLLLCGSATTGCHGWVEANPAAARTLGYRVPPGTDPANWPVRVGTRTLLLTDDGWQTPAGKETTP